MDMTSRQTRQRFVSLAAALLLLSLSVPAWSKSAQFEPAPIDEESYGESYTAVAQFEDGTYLLLQYFFTNAGFGDGKGACRALVVPPAGKATNSVAKASRDEWKYIAGENRLVVGQCSLSSRGSQTSFIAKTDTVTASLRINAASRRIKPPGHRIKSDGKFYESELFIPWATASATLSASGRVWKVNGHAYLDHTRSTAIVKNLADRWVRFRGFQGKRPVLIEIRYPPKGMPKAWSWTQGKVAPIKGADIKTTGARANLKVSLKNDTLSGQLAARKVIYRYRPTKQYGLLGRLAKPWIGDPRIITSQGELTLADGSIVSGILEEARFTD